MKPLARLSRLFEGGCFATTISQSHDAAASQIIAHHSAQGALSGDYRVNFRDGSEMTACCADNLEDAVKTAVEMARTRDVMQAVDEAVATEPLQDRIADMPLNPKANLAGSGGVKAVDAMAGCLVVTRLESRA